MKRFLQTSVICLQFVLLCAWAAADDQRLLCDKPVTLAAPLTRAQVQGVTDGATQAQPTFDALAQVYEGSLTPEEKQREDARLFIKRLREATNTEPAVWDISPDLVNRKQQVLFGRFDEVVIFDCTQPTVPGYQMNMAYLSGVVKRLTQPGAFIKLTEFDTVIGQRKKEADALLKNGLPMWPWENYINGLRLGKSDAEPLFLNQWIVMRPSAALEFSTRSRADAKLNASLAIEPLGFIHYKDRAYDSWWGASAVVTVSTDAGMGYGALLRYDKFTLGLTLHKSTQAGRNNDVFIMMGVDLYDYLNSKRSALPMGFGK